jgi:hypothetical protein
VFNGSPAIRQERDELIAELMAWAEAKLSAGARPVPLARALLDVSHLAGGRGEAGEEFLRTFSPYGKPPPTLPGFETIGQARAAGRAFFTKANGKHGCEDRDFHIVQNEHDRWEFRDGRRPSG